jgi:hypothetical protein
MEKRLMELVTKKFLTVDEINEIGAMENVSIEYKGYSGIFISYYWCIVYYEDDEFDVYLKI